MRQVEFTVEANLRHQIGTRLRAGFVENGRRALAMRSGCWRSSLTAAAIILGVLGCAGDKPAAMPRYTMKQSGYSAFVEVRGCLTRASSRVKSADAGTTFTFVNRFANCGEFVWCARQTAIVLKPSIIQFFNGLPQRLTGV